MKTSLAKAQENKARDVVTPDEKYEAIAGSVEASNSNAAEQSGEKLVVKQAKAQWYSDPADMPVCWYTR